MFLDWSMSFEVMCDASGMALGIVLGERRGRSYILSIIIAKLLTVSKNYTMGEQELLTMVFNFDKL